MNDYPLVNFHFRVTGGGGGIDMQFQSVSGLNTQLQTESWKEGGEHRFEHTIPVRVKYSDLVLKRGVVQSGSSELTKWFKNAFENFQFEPKELLVELLGEDHKPLVYWKVVHALPKNWKLDDFNAESGKILIETMELSYNYFEIKR